MQGYSSSEDSSPEDSDVIADVIDERNIVDVIDLTATDQEGSSSECQNVEHQHLGFLDLTQDSDAEWVDSEAPKIIDLTE
jgi:hypothetical protein